MKETTPSAMPACFEKWCRRFDDVFKTKAEKQGFRQYLGGLLGESRRKNLSEMAKNAIGVVYHRLHHFLTDAQWSAQAVNERRLQVMNQCRQTKIQKGFSLIVDDSGHRKSGNFTAGVGRQYLGEIGKTDNGIVTVTTHLYDGKKSLPLDIELYQHSSSLPEGKKDAEFKKKPEIAIDLIDRSLARGNKPGIVLIDSGYGNNTTFLSQLEERNLKYLGGIAKNRKVKLEKKGNAKETIRVDKLAASLSKSDFTEVQLAIEKPKTLWVAVVEGEISRLEGKKSIAIVMNASSFSEATEVDYFLTNVKPNQVTPQWVVKTYSQRNWVEVFYREAKGNLGLKEYQVRDKRSLLRHFILVFCAYTFIIWHQLTGGFRRIWSNRPLNTFSEALEAFRTAITYRFLKWMQENWDVFVAYKASFGYILA
jgi:SRSO17 transposase